MKIGPRYIEGKLYKQILRTIPIPCVDVVIVHRGKPRTRASTMRDRFLLGKRVNKPARGEWWFVGGRILKGETLEQAVARHVKLETGINKIKIKKLLTTRGTMFGNSAQGPPSHTINTVFLVEAGTDKLSLGDGENRELRWFSRINKNWRPYVKEMLRLAGFR